MAFVAYRKEPSVEDDPVKNSEGVGRVRYDLGDGCSWTTPIRDDDDWAYSDYDD